LKFGFVVARDPRQLFEMLRSNSEMLQQVRQNSPQIADSIQRGDFGTKNMLKLIKKKYNLSYFRYIPTTNSCSIT
jgi:hypothetical protein